jgi:hypothetical protein
VVLDAIWAGKSKIVFTVSAGCSADVTAAADLLNRWPHRSPVFRLNANTLNNRYLTDANLTGERATLEVYVDTGDLKRHRVQTLKLNGRLLNTAGLRLSVDRTRPMRINRTSITLAEARFAEGELIIVDGEQMQIESGGGTTNPTVRRGVANTNPAAHNANAPIYSGYDYTGLVIDPIDETGTDESVWYRLALTQGEPDTAVQGEPLNLGDKPHDQTFSFWRRCTVLAGTPVQNKLDIKLRLTGTQNPIL